MTTPPSHEDRHIAVMDTTLRDGEQTPNVSYTPAEKLQLARLLLLDVEVDRIEIASSVAATLSATRTPDTAIAPKRRRGRGEEEERSAPVCRPV